MALKFKKGDSVKQIIAPIVGTVSEVMIVDSDVVFKVEYIDENGNPHEAVLTGDQLDAA